jgi:hypothetical protein
VRPLERFGPFELDAGGGTSHLTSLAQPSSVWVTWCLVATEEAPEGVLEVEETVMVVTAARLGAKEGDLERPESEGVGVVTCVEALEEEKTEASMVSESLSSAIESVEEAEEDGRDWPLDVAGEGTGFTVESGGPNPSSEVASLSVSSVRARGEWLVTDWCFGKIVLIEWESFGMGSSSVATLRRVGFVE